MWGWLKELFKVQAPKNTIEEVKPLIKRVINAFEMGKTTIDYSAIYIYRDGPNNTKQITVAWGLTSSGNLTTFLKEYIKSGGRFSNEFKPYIPFIKQSSIVNNAAFINLLKKAGREDQVYRNVMDKMYDELYYNPAKKFFDQNGFTLPLSLLVIFDSYIHSGSILASLRAKFPERPPAAGGNEKVWIKQYCEARANWLANHSKTILHATAVRPRTYLNEIRRDNWSLDKLPINCNGVKVS